MAVSDLRLVQWAGNLSGAAARLNFLSSTVLGRKLDGWHEALGHSTLNNDGSPVQICATYTDGIRKIRVIGDPASHEGAPEQRLECAGQALKRTLEVADARCLEFPSEILTTYMLPSSKDAAELIPGCLWLAAGLDGGAAVYVNARWGNRVDRWSDAARWLTAVLPNPGASLRLLNVLSSSCLLASVGLEGASTLATARAKLYWRLTGPVTLADLGLSILDVSGASDLLSVVTADEAIPLSGLVFSAAYRLIDGSFADCKVDVCTHCIPRPATDWIDVLECCGVPRCDVEQGLGDNACETALVGVGASGEGQLRVNVYFKRAQ